MSISENGGAHLAPVQPAAPLAASEKTTWRGGKRNLAKRLAARIETIPHSCYAEAAWAASARARASRPRSEILNFYRRRAQKKTTSSTPSASPETARTRWRTGSTSAWPRGRPRVACLADAPPEILTDIQRAARWVTLQRLARAGKAAHLATPGQMAPSVHRPAQLKAARMARLIRAAHARLQGVRR